MQYKNPFADVTEDCPVPNKLISRVDEYYKDLSYIDIVRVAQSTTKTVNQIRWETAPEGHPNEEVLAICEATMQAILYDATEEGAATYRALLFVNDVNKDRPLKKTVTLNQKEIKLLLQDELGSDKDQSSGDATSITEEAFAMVKEVMSLNTTFHGEALSSLLEQNRELHDRLLEHSRNSTMASENMQKLLGSMSEQLRDAAIQKDRALSILHTSRVAEIEAESQKARNEMFKDMLKPAFMIIAQQIAAKTGMNLMGDDVAPVSDEDMTEAAVPKEATEEEKQAAKKAAAERFEREPVVCCLERLHQDMTPEQWKAIDSIDPSTFASKLREAMKITDEDKAVTAMYDVASDIIASPSIQDKLSEILSGDQKSIVATLFNKVTGLDTGGGKETPEASKETPEGDDNASS